MSNYMVFVYSENDLKSINTLRGQNAKQFVKKILFVCCLFYNAFK
jgi:hypothetical protein